MPPVAEESDVGFESTAHIATEAFESKDVTFSPPRMQWLYERAFGQGSTVIAAYDAEEGKKIGQIRFSRSKSAPVSVSAGFPRNTCDFRVG
jgi:hypothetical protein